MVFRKLPGDKKFNRDTAAKFGTFEVFKLQPYLVSLIGSGTNNSDDSSNLVRNRLLELSNKREEYFFVHSIEDLLVVKDGTNNALFALGGLRNYDDVGSLIFARKMVESPDAIGFRMQQCTDPVSATDFLVQTLMLPDDELTLASKASATPEYTIYSRFSRHLLLAD
jgi:hypothetical protein